MFPTPIKGWVTIIQKVSFKYLPNSNKKKILAKFKFDFYFQIKTQKMTLMAFYI